MSFPFLFEREEFHSDESFWDNVMDMNVIMFQINESSAFEIGMAHVHYN